MLSLGRIIGPSGASGVGSLLGGVAGSMPFLRNRLIENFKAAGLQPTREQVDRYFRRLGCWAGWSSAVYLRGFVESGVSARITLHDSFRFVEESMARGKGVVLASPHAFCHELAAAAISLRHRFVLLARESKNPARESIKARWYQATGVTVVKRPRKSSLMADTVTAIRTLQNGALLGITPDVIVPPEKGMPVQMFGHTVHLSPGAVVLASRVGSPIVSCWCDWVEGRTAREDRLILKFGPPVEYANRKQKPEETRQHLQEWCQSQEANFTRNPEYWMFWLDKHWTRALRSPAAPNLPG